MKNILPLLTLALLAPCAHSAEFAILIYETKQDLALRKDQGPAGKKYWADYTQFAAVLAQAGAMRDGAALEVTSSDGKPDALHLGGYFKIEAPTLAAAEKLAQQAPSPRRGGAVEVRPTLANPAMPAK
jgi:hypothetical protein